MFQRCGRIVLPVVALSVLLGLRTSVLAATTTDDGKEKAIESQVKTFVLPSGLRFIVLERHDVPIFSFRTFVDTGAVDEHPGITGIAHMFEHMAFKGTTHVGTTDWPKEQVALAEVDRTYAALREEVQKGASADTTKIAELKRAFDAAQADAERYVVPNGYSKILEPAGVSDINAGTQEDETIYQSDFPSNKLELWAMMEGDRLTNPVLREFFKERDVVMEERRMRYESAPAGRLFLDFLDNCFTVFPYRAGPIGRSEDLRTFSREEAQKFHDEHYVAKNITIALVGDVNTAEVEKLANEYFSGVPDKPPAPPVSVVEPPQTKERRIVHTEDAQPIVFFGYHIGAVTDPRWHSYEALADILGEGRSGRLYTRLVKEEQVAVQLDMNPGFPGQKYPNLLFGVLVPAAGVDPDTALAAMDREVGRMLTTAPVTEEELQGFKTRKLAQFWQGVEDNGQIAENLAYYQMLLGDWRKLFREVEEVNAITTADVMSTAKECLRAENRTVGILRSGPAGGGGGGSPGGGNPGGEGAGATGGGR